MTYAVLSDIHGNALALKAVLEDINSRSIKRIINLGDSLYGPLDPKETYELIIENRMISVSGNEDRELIDGSANHTITYTLSQIPADAVSWLEDLPFETVVDDILYCCHGTPLKDTTYMAESIEDNKVILRGEDELSHILKDVRQKIILCGHSHMPRFLKTGNKLIINPGSVGCPAYDDDDPAYHKMESGNPFAEYVVVSIDKDVKVEHVTVPYDYESAARLAEQNGRSDWARWLRTGRA